MDTVKYAVIGGSGLYAIEGMKLIEEKEVGTPFGKPSSPIAIGEVSGKRVAFMARHGKNHTINPSQLNVRANIYALKSLGVEQIISVSAVGSLKEEIAPTHLVLPNQLIDKTKSRVNTFFDDAAVHVGFAHPFCNRLRERLLKASEGVGVTVHDGGIYVCMEGPLFSTIAESNLHRSWGASLIGMTALPEAKLAREAEICYATVAMSTDYDVWNEEPVTVDMVIKNLQAATAHAKKLIEKFFALDEADRDCECPEALKNALLTPISAISKAKRKDWELLLGKYL